MWAEVQPLARLMLSLLRWNSDRSLHTHGARSEPVEVQPRPCALCLYAFDPPVATSDTLWAVRVATMNTCIHKQAYSYRHTYAGIRMQAYALTAVAGPKRRRSAARTGV